MNIDTTHIHIVSNDYVWDNDWYATAIAWRVMHTYNKASFQLDNFDRYQEFYKGLTDAIVLWDSLGDSDLRKIGAFSSTTAFGYINSKEPDSDTINAYDKHFDHLLKRDDWFTPITTHLQTLLAA